jgi:hypothetical protein
MNREVINAVADAIARSELTKSGFGFNMAAYWAESGLDDHTGHGCGTVGCIAGWTAMMFDADGNRLPQRSAGECGPLADAPTDAAQAMGLSPAAAAELFLASGVDLRSVTNCEAVAVLRHLAETGMVDWRVACRDRIKRGYRPVRHDKGA